MAAVSVLSKTKICHLTSAHNHNDVRIFVKECSSLAAAGYDVHIVAPGAPNSVINSVRIHSVKKTYKNRLIRMTLTVYAVFKKAVEIDANLYHFHDPELMLVALILKMFGKKIIYDVHEDLPRQILSKQWIKKSIRPFISRQIESLENCIAKRFDAIVTSTPHILQRFTRLGCQGFDIKNYPRLEEFSRPTDNWNGKERAVCYVGGLNEVRGIFHMVEAIGMTDVRLLLAGSFDSEKHHQTAIEMQGWANVELLGEIGREAVVETLAKAMAGMVILKPIVNYLDALPIKMFEYMAAGIPVICSDFPLWKEIVESNNCGICVNPVDSDEIAKAVLWIVDHPDEAQRMGQNGRRAVEDKYSWEGESHDLLELYSKIFSH